jgi:hypothetical protein
MFLECDWAQLHAQSSAAVQFAADGAGADGYGDSPTDRRAARCEQLANLGELGRAAKALVGSGGVLTESVCASLGSHGPRLWQLCLDKVRLLHPPPAASDASPEHTNDDRGGSSTDGAATRRADSNTDYRNCDCGHCIYCLFLDSEDGTGTDADTDAASTGDGADTGTGTGTGAVAPVATSVASFVAATRGTSAASLQNVAPIDVDAGDGGRVVALATATATVIGSGSSSGSSSSSSSGSGSGSSTSSNSVRLQPWLWLWL